MTQPTPHLYERLPGRGGGFLSRSSLWLGSEHLLRVERRGFAEMYHRFYFRDIQAIVLRPTAQWQVEMVISGMMLALFLLLALATGEMWRIAWAIMAGLSAVFFIAKLVQGPTCICHIQTAVQLMLLPSVNRQRHARRILARIEPLIAAAQGAMSAEQMAGAMRNAPPPVLPATKPVPITRPATPAPIPDRRSMRHEHGRWHEILCWLLAGDTAVSMAMFFTEHALMQSVGILLMALQVGAGITALIKQARTDLPAMIKFVAWSALGALAMYLAIAVLYVIFRTWQDPSLDLEMLTPRNDTFVMWLHAAGVLITGGLAGLGLTSLYRFRRDYAEKQLRLPTPPALPTKMPVQTDTNNAGES